MPKFSKQSISTAWTAVNVSQGQEDQLSRKQIVTNKMMKLVLRSQYHTPNKKRYSPEDAQESLLPQLQKQLSGLESLPADILYLIASMLPSEAVYSLSLTSRTMSRFFSRQQLISNDPLAKKHFLLLLENDRPDYLVCYTCNRLYRWRKPGSRKVHLCPGRKTILHHDYGRLDIKSRQKRIPREMVDLTLRGAAKGRKHGTSLKRLTKSLQEKESLDRHLRMRAQSYVKTCVISNSLLVTTVFGVRIRTAETSHPLYWLASHNIPNDNFLLPPAREFRHPRLSTFTRLLGCNYHEFLMFNGASYGDDYAFLACNDCKSSIRIARDYYFDKWINVNIETAQAFGTRDDLSGETWCYAGLTREHRRQQPDEVMHFMRCLTSAADQPAFAPQLLSEDESRDMDLSLNAWFNRHVYSYSQRLWPQLETPDDTNDSSDDDEDNGGDNPVYSEADWSLPGPNRVTQTSLSIRKRWLEYSMIGLFVCVYVPTLIYQEIKRACSRRLRTQPVADGDTQQEDGDSDLTEIVTADGTARPPQEVS